MPAFAQVNPAEGPVSLPAALVYGTVSWTAVGLAEDTAVDTDAYPDASQINGTATFTAQPSKIVKAGPDAVTVLPLPLTYQIVNGRLADQEGRTRISLVGNDSPGTTPQGWSYHVDWQLADGVTFGSFDFELAGGQHVDLTDVQVLEAPEPGVVIIKGEPGPMGPAGDPWTPMIAYTDFSSQPDGGPLTTLDSGQPVQNFGSGLFSVSGGRLVQSAETVSYMQADLGERVGRIGFDFIIPPSGGGTAALVVPSQPWDDGTFDEAAVHFWIQPSGWSIGYWHGSGEDNYAAGTFFNPLPVGTHRVELILNGPDCYMILPGGMIQVVHDQRLNDFVGNHAIWELYSPDPGVVPLQIESVWADGVTPAFSSAVTMEDVVRGLNVGTDQADPNSLVRRSGDGSANFQNLYIFGDAVSAVPATQSFHLVRKDYVDEEIAATGDDQNTPDTLVRRDANGWFQASGIWQMDELGGDLETIDRRTGPTIGYVRDYVKQRATRLSGARWVALGDSITAADSYLRYAAARLGGRLRVVGNAGVGGNEIPQMLARFDADVTPLAPTVVSLLAGTNDYTFGATDAQFQQRVTDFVAKVRSIGATPLLMTSLPCNVLADLDRAKIIHGNLWMANYAAAEGIPLVDVYAALADPAGFGLYRPELVNPDGIHPNEDGHNAIGIAIADSLDLVLPPLPSPLAVTNGDPTNLLTNGLMKDGDGDGWADDWNQTWGLDAGTWTYSIVADAAAPGGTMSRTAFAGATGHTSRGQDFTAGFASGDQLRVTALVNLDPGTYAVLVVRATSAGGDVYQTVALRRSISHGLLDATIVLPAGTTSMRVAVDAGANGSGVTGNVDLGAITCRNLTALGIV